MVKLMDKDVFVYPLYHVYEETRYWIFSSIGCKGRAKTRSFEGERPFESVSITGIHLHPPNPMKCKLCEAKFEFKNLNLSSEQFAYSLIDECIVVRQGI